MVLRRGNKISFSSFKWSSITHGVPATIGINETHPQLAPKRNRIINSNEEELIPNNIDKFSAIYQVASDDAVHHRGKISSDQNNSNSNNNTSACNNNSNSNNNNKNKNKNCKNTRQHISPSSATTTSLGLCECDETTLACTSVSSITESSSGSESSIGSEYQALEEVPPTVFETVFNTFCALNGWDCVFDYTDDDDSSDSEMSVPDIIVLSSL
mmetsp:Transcript_65031/g.76967  ORF Transcript_65031/g.76967 Transcript_65031/m.76967 type:complete len:213 (+) Transcript_65031:90-728(+)